MKESYEDRWQYPRPRVMGADRKERGQALTGVRVGRPYTSLDFITVGGRYLIGGKAEYLLEGSIARSGSNVTFDVSHSTSDLFLAQVGFTYQF